MNTRYGTALLLSLAMTPAAAELQAGINALGRAQYELAIEEFTPQAERGDPVAQNFLAHTYREMQDYPQSYAWYHLSAECNDSIDAQVEIQILKQKMSPNAIETGVSLGEELYRALCEK